MEIAYFNITDLAEQMKYLLALREENRAQFEAQQLRSIASSAISRSRMLCFPRVTLGISLSIFSPMVHENPNPAPIILSDASSPYAPYYLRLQCECTQESYIWSLCTSSLNEVTESQIKSMGQKNFLLASVPSAITIPWYDVSSTTLFIHVLCEGLHGGSTIAHGEIPFVLDQEADVGAQASHTGRVPRVSGAPRAVKKPGIPAQQRAIASRAGGSGSRA